MCFREFPKTPSADAARLPKRVDPKIRSAESARRPQRGYHKSRTAYAAKNQERGGRGRRIATRLGPDPKLNKTKEIRKNTKNSEY